MTNPIAIVADVKATPGHGDELWTHIQTLVQPTRAEDGNLTYDVARDLDEPDVFYFLERWSSPDTFQAHLQATHVASYDAASAHLIGRAVRISICTLLTSQLTPGLTSQLTSEATTTNSAAS